MLTIDERFEAIIADVSPSAKMTPFQEPVPEKGAPVEEGPAEEKPHEEKPAEDE